MDINNYTEMSCPECKAELLVEKGLESWFCGRCGKKFDTAKAQKPEAAASVKAPAAEENNTAVSGRGGLIIKGGVLTEFKGTQKEVEIPEDVTKIASGAFRGCETISNVIIPDSVTEIEDSVFENCINLTGVRLPSQMKKINYKTFNGCDALKTIVIPESVEQIAYNAMCCGLQEIVFENPETTWEPENEYTNPSFEVDKKGSGNGVSRIIFKGVTYEAAELFRFGSIAAYLRSQGLCPKCGGKFGMFNKCKSCGAKKDQ